MIRIFNGGPRSGEREECETFPDRIKAHGGVYWRGFIDGGEEGRSAIYTFMGDPTVPEIDRRRNQPGRTSGRPLGARR